MMEEKITEDLIRSQSSPGAERWKGEAAQGVGSLPDRESELLDINKAPADFVVVRGQKYKVSKTTPSSSVIPSESNDRSSPEIVAFKGAMENYESLVSKQSADLRKQASRIELLERFLVQNSDKLGGADVLKELGLDGSLRESGGGLNTNAWNKPRIGLAARRRAESSSAASAIYDSLAVNTDPFLSNSPEIASDTPSVSALTDADSEERVRGRKESAEISPISAMNDCSTHDLITPKGGDFPVHKSPPLIRRSHSDGILESSEGGDVEVNANTELDGGRGSASKGSSVSRELINSAQKEKRARHKDEDLLTVDLSSGGLNNVDSANPSPARAPPKGLAARLSMGSQERRKLNGKRRASSSENLRALARDECGKEKGTCSEGSPPGAGDTGTPQRGRPIINSSGSDKSVPLSDHSRATSVTSRTSSRAASPGIGVVSSLPPGSLFKWKDASGSPSNDLDSVAIPHLFIAHDNPQLGSSVATTLRGSGQPGMGFMLESKDEGGLTVFVIGTIAYSGPFEGIEHACIDAGDMARGSLCLVGTDLVGYKTNLKTITTRPRGELIEIDLAPEKKDKSDNGKSSTAKAMAEGALTKLPLSTRESLKALMRTCKSRVDVILDPYHTDGKWYPYWEGRRKMAPQFRSKGIGYLRLGDDMSNYGSAFLSLDAGMTYLDDGASGAITPNNASRGESGGSQGSSQRSLGYTHPPRGGSSGSTSSGNGNGYRPLSNDSSGGDSLYSSGNRQIGSSGGSMSPERASADPHLLDSRTGSARSTSSGRGDAGNSSGIALIHEFGGVLDTTTPSPTGHDPNPDLIEKEMEVKELIAALRNPDMKWSERTQRLQRLGDIGLGCAGASSAQEANAHGVVGDKLVMDAISALRDTLMKQNNPHILKAALRCLPAVCEGARHRVSCSVAWKSLILESIHMIRTSSKVGEEAREALEYLHHSSNQDATSSGAEVERMQPCVSLCQLTGSFEEIIFGPRSKGSKGASNSSKVIQWLQSVAASEMEASLTALATYGTPKFRPSVYERIDAALLFKKSKTAFGHREEAVRDAMVLLGALLIALDILQNATDAQIFVSWADSLAIETDADAKESLVLKMMSPSLAGALSEMKKVASRVQPKVLAAASRQMLASSQALSTLCNSRPISASRAGGSGSAKKASNVSSTADRYFLSTPSSRASRRDSGSANGSGSGSRSRPSTNGAQRSSPAGTPRSPHNLRQQAEQELFPDAPSTSNGNVHESGGIASLTSSAAPSASAHGHPAESNNSTNRGASEAPSPSSSPNLTTDDIVKLQQSLSDSWFEIRLMLRLVPSTATSWNSLYTTVKGSASFVRGLTEAAAKVEQPRASLLRAILPFDESTSSHDQSKVTSPNQKAEALLSQLDSAEVGSLREQAVGLRKVIRIKMADEADLRQAIAATDMLRSFCAGVDQLTARTGRTAIDVIAKLEAET